MVIKAFFSLQLTSLKRLGIIFPIFIFSLISIHFSLFTISEAKVYINIESPGIKKLPIAIHDIEGQDGGTISDIVRKNLDFTGLFLILDKNAYIEGPTQDFNPKNWSVLGAEVVVKGTVSGDRNIEVMISLYDVYEGREVLRQKYKGERSGARLIAHHIANDIYKYLTDENGVFTTRVAFVAEDDGKKGLYIMDWDGANIKKLGIRGNFVLTPHWSKDGTKLLYSAEKDGQWAIFMLDFSTMTERKLFSSPGLNMTGNFFPDGNEIVFASSKDETYGLYSLRISDLSTKRITSSRGIEVSPTISPDGRHVAYVSDRGGTPQIYIMNRYGYDAVRLTFEGNYNTSPSWSPDGSKIVFVSRRSGKNQIFTINADGTGLTQLTDIGDNEDPSFSPDGRFIIFASKRSGTRSIYIMRADGESQKRITPEWLKSFGPKWSPN